MKRIHIVLFEPEIPQNTGNIARTCAATGASLHLIKPLGFTIDDKKLKRAGLDYWDKLDITYYEGLADFMAAHDGKTIYYFTTKARQAYSEVSYREEDEVYLMFGKESAGLPEELLFPHGDTALRIPMRQGLRSLNLSNSVAVAVFEVLRQWEFPELSSEGALTKFDWNDKP